MTRLYTYPEAAAELRVEVPWLQRHIKKLPHSKLGRVVVFTEDDIARIAAMFHHEPEQAGPVPAGSGSITQLKPLPSRTSRSA